MMGIFDKLHEQMKVVESESNHNGYWYSISNALIILVCGMLCGQKSIDDIHDWARSTPTRRFLLEQFGIERIFCRAQFYNILKCVDADKFKLSFACWMKFVLGTQAKKTIAVDGKTVCGTGKLTKDGSVLHIASAIVSELNLVIGSVECGTKTGEIAAFRELMELLDVSESVVVADALHCNPKSANAVIEAGADYLFVVKDNQPSLKDDIEFYFQNENSPSYTTIEKNGGRIEKRTAYVCNEIEWLYGKDRFANLSCIGAIHREFEKDSNKSSQWHYYISSKTLSSQELLTHARLEWAVESMHWLLDVHYAEDKTRVWDMNVQKVLNTARKIALNMTRIFKSASCSERTPFTSIMKENLFDLEKFSEFLNFFRGDGNLWN